MAENQQQNTSQSPAPTESPKDKKPTVFQASQKKTKEYEYFLFDMDGNQRASRAD